jgi:hypothetical protein
MKTRVVCFHELGGPEVLRIESNEQVGKVVVTVGAW